jgi:hypothetical protein
MNSLLNYSSPKQYHPAHGLTLQVIVPHKQRNTLLLRIVTLTAITYMYGYMNRKQRETVYYLFIKKTVYYLLFALTLNF